MLWCSAVGHPSDSLASCRFDIATLQCECEIQTFTKWRSPGIYHKLWGLRSTY